ncbi:hypothetical protein BD626DRAFT_549673 [Schizophyllum amplum]|uniref:Histone deacetylase interacting domain-containing protein n=1 Tax=Schizophyllum amplum TaxID=97359 RepID=A0A550C6B7_9AGAR|nr:hypothetical protein BD626DRAFT_549673 [Auriculariopsis ampla]
MKEFKSQLIDTPGVIKRVSQLFNGHPMLIQGFNTFLPVGYRIECSGDSGITVTTPTGTVMQATDMRWSMEPKPAPPHHPHHAEPQAINYITSIKQSSPDKYLLLMDVLSAASRDPGDLGQYMPDIKAIFKDDPTTAATLQKMLQSDQPFAPENFAALRTSTPVGGGKRKAEREGHASTSSTTQAKKKRKVEASVPAKPKRSRHQQQAPTSNARERTPPPSGRRAAPSAARPVAPPPDDETQFFERVKCTLESRELYNEFLRYINLFTQGHIDSVRLVKECRNLLREDSELLRQLKEIVGWDQRKEDESHMLVPTTHSWTHPQVVNLRPGRVDLSVMYGSYRKLPADEAKVQCSGRDDMCRTVLNDQWVSHATWTNDEDIMAAPLKKNPYEEALHRSEEERHEYDFHIDAIVRTIAMLEPINNKIMQLSVDDRATFKLKPNFGGSGKSVHHRVIKKIYGRAAGAEVIQMMQDQPALAIPVVLQRLKHKEEEWKRAQREWNKVWREVDARNYAKSLDYQGIAVRAADKRATSQKTLVQQIAAAREEQACARACFTDPLFARTRPRHQMEFAVDDAQVLQDALKLTLSFVDRTQAQVPFAERRRIESFLRAFVPLFFMLDPVAFNNAFVVVQETLDSEASEDAVDDDGESVASGGSRASRGRKTAAGDLRKKLLKSEQAKSTGTTRVTRSRGDASPVPGSRLASPAPADDEAFAESAAAQSRKGRKNIFFTNTTFYCLLRLLEIIYTRLALFKSLSMEGDPTQPPPNNFGFSSETMSIAERTTVDHYYDLLLDSCERLFDNEIEQPAFEEQMRFMFGVKNAYKIFTIDKVIGAFVKQVQAILADPKSQELLENLKRERSLASPTVQDQINTRRNAEKILGPDENLFRIDWLHDNKMMTMQLIGKDEPSVDDSEAVADRWHAYLDAYVCGEQTSGVSQAHVRRPFLRSVRGADPMVATDDGLEIRICVRTYRFFYVALTEDVLVRLPRHIDETTKARLGKREELRKAWLERSLAEAPPTAA